jgi:acyl dehydratase
VATLHTSELARPSSMIPEEPKTSYSGWFQVTQEQVDAFAAATGDNQWIHKANAKDTGSPFNAPIAHGLLLVCLAINLARQCGALDETTWILYGFEKIRFRAPVHCGASIRCLTTIVGNREVGDRTLAHVRFVIEIQDAKIPALVADCLLLNVDVPSGAVRNRVENLVD